MFFILNNLASYVAPPQKAIATALRTASQKQKSGQLSGRQKPNGHPSSPRQTWPFCSKHFESSLTQGTVVHFLLRDLQLGAGSTRSSSFFLKIEEMQVIAFLALHKEVRPQIVLDIGANVGFYSLVTSKFFPETRILSFEPTPKTFTELCENITSNKKLNQIQSYQVALSDTQGIVEFLDYDNLSGRNGIRETSFHNPNQARTISIQTDTLDRVMGDWRGTALVKIDTEGHEANVLKGGATFFLTNRCIIQAEAEHGSASSKNKTENVLNELKYFKLFRIGPDNYYTNIQPLYEDSIKLELLEKIISLQSDLRWHDKFVL